GIPAPPARGTCASRLCLRNLGRGCAPRATRPDRVGHCPPDTRRRGARRRGTDRTSPTESREVACRVRRRSWAKCNLPAAAEENARPFPLGRALAGALRRTALEGSANLGPPIVHRAREPRGIRVEPERGASVALDAHVRAVLDEPDQRVGFGAES